MGLRVVGVEWDHSACRTAMAAGHPRVRADVASLPLHPFAGIRGLIASPPCPTFSAAGKGSGRHDLPLLLLAIKRLGAGEWPAEQIAACQDERTALTLEPLRWALALQPEWISWEQVPAVLPVWEACAAVLREHGYSVATGVLSAEQWGVPQTRKRAILVANRTHSVALPAPTHTRYVKGKPRQADGLLPWVSMADALGWPSDEVVGFPRLADTSSNKVDQRVSIDGKDYRARDLRAADLPAQVVTEKVRSWQRWALRNNNTDNASTRTLDQPAGTVYFGARSNGAAWVHDRHATTVVASFGADTISAPGWRKAGDGPRQAADGGVKVEPWEAGVLQSFRADYPWQGAITKQRQQIGNACPPLLMHAVLQAAGAADHLTRQETRP